MRNEDELLVNKGTEVWLAEEEINSDEPIYLFTWCPNPSELPDADFTTQHLYNVNLLSDYLAVCATGLCCVESTQLGHPHYHGWYQLSNNEIHEEMRLVYIKTLQRFGLLKITKSRGYYRINSYNTRSNCLGYYKKDLLDPMLFVTPNPITSTTKCDIDWSLNMLFFVKEGRGTVADLEEKISLKQFYQQFYKNSEVTKFKIVK